MYSGRRMPSSMGRPLTSRPNNAETERYAGFSSTLDATFDKDQPEAGVILGSE